MDNLQAKLSSWKVKFLNMAGRTTLAKSSLSHMANHIMQYIKLLPNINNHIDRVQQNFIWGTTNEKRKLHLISWDTVTKNKKADGLGVQNSRVRNNDILTKLA
ncbi:hypothetical protein H5410_013229 [Solanum commersonii]|uniref:Reverse transcriptase n=1 Tax=Solanum commersonii TaxID=4109 RepID=A0A9J6AUR1_SOLCO|nr:hypothetical protein H5410_013229 [Solanum commersonii]